MRYAKDIQQHAGVLILTSGNSLKHLNDHINNHPDLKQKRELLDSIPRHRRTHPVAIILAFYADTDRFANSRQAAALPDSILGNTNQAVLSEANPGYRRLAILLCVKPSICCLVNAIQNRLGQAL